MRIFVHNLHLEAAIGVEAHERGRRQTLILDIEAQIRPPQGDAIAQTVDYTLLAQAARGVAEAPHVDLVETFASQVANACLALEGVNFVEITVRKPEPLAPAVVGVRTALGQLQ